jgi:hypothetical protein
MEIKYNPEDAKKLIKNINDLIENLECDELSFLEVIEPGYEKEIESSILKKHCSNPDISDQNENLN